MDLNKLHYFYTVAERQHITQAAQALYISQPALSKAMKQLEQELGVPLFYKQKRGIRLTDFGLHLKNQLTPVFSVLDRLPGELAQLKNETLHTVKLNVLVASIITTDAIASYKTLHPEINFQVVQQAEDTDCHISITTGTEICSFPESDRQCVITEDIFLAVPKKGKYASLERIDLQDVKDEWFISTSYARSFRKISDSFCLEAGFKPNVTFESDFPSAVRNLISAGAGIGFWPAFSFGRPSADMQLLQIQKPLCQRKLVIRLHKCSPASDAAGDFYAYLVDYLQEKAK